MSENAEKLWLIIQGYAKARKQLPTLGELQVLMNFSSQAPLQSCLMRLVEDGRLLLIRA